jgi:AcrR family transcriptional regulator
LRQHLQAAYRGAILDAGEAVFSEAGFHAAKMTDIADEAGVAVGTLYKHFASKEAIFEAIAERTRLQFAETLKPIGEIAEPLEQLAAFERVAFEFIEERGSLFAIATQLGYNRNDEEVRSRAEALAFLKRIVEHAMANQQVRADISADTQVIAIAGLMQGAIDDWLARGRRTRLGASAEPLLRILLEGIER